MARQGRDQDWASWIVEQYKQQRANGSSARDAWSAIKERFAQSYDSGDKEQAWKNYSGKALENIVQEEFDHQLQKINLGQQIEVRRWNQVHESLVRKILSEALWLRGELQEPYFAESQVDFVATETELEHKRPVRVIAVYSCKASLRERFQQDLFWADKLRARGIHFCFITLDIDGVLHKAIRTGKLRSKQAKMAAALYDRIYLLSDESIKHFTRIFRTVDSLAEDLKRWLEAG